jgi:hypothetical protein
VKARVEEKKRGLGLELGFVFDSSAVGSGMRLGGKEEIDVCQVLRDRQTWDLRRLLLSKATEVWFPRCSFWWVRWFIVSFVNGNTNMRM